MWPKCLKFKMRNGHHIENSFFAITRQPIHAQNFILRVKQFFWEFVQWEWDRYPRSTERISCRSSVYWITEQLCSSNACKTHVILAGAPVIGLARQLTRWRLYAVAFVASSRRRSPGRRHGWSCVPESDATSIAEWRETWTNRGVDL